MNNKIQNLTLCSLFTALLAAGTFIKIPAFPVPVTLQLEIVILCSLVLGRKRAVVCSVVYLLAGLLGLPVFAGGGGIGYVFQPTFGYLIGFVFASFLTEFSVKSKTKLNLKNAYVASLAGMAAIYLPGLIYLWLIKSLYFGQQVGAWQIIYGGLLSTLPADLILCAGTAMAAVRLNKILNIRKSSAEQELLKNG